MGIRFRSIAASAIVIVAVAACSSAGATSAPSVAPSVAPTDASSAAPSDAPSAAPSAAAADVQAVEVGTLGKVLVAGSNGMTVYIFTKDVKDSGKSACTGGCLEKWPALTVPAGATPSGGEGVSGALGTITREDDGMLQVTYNGLPLYFFANDSAPGDANGVYENWEAVKP